MLEEAILFHCHPTGIGKKKVGSFQRTCHTAGK
jgi:hypothetical protein